jgi:hypothetical protein
MSSTAPRTAIAEPRLCIASNGLPEWWLRTASHHHDAVRFVSQRISLLTVAGSESGLAVAIRFCRPARSNRSTDDVTHAVTANASPPIKSRVATLVEDRSSRPMARPAKM